MKFLVFTSQIYQIGGVEKLSLELVRALNQQNIQADLMCLYGSEKTISYSGQISTKSNKDERLHFLNIPERPNLFWVITGVVRYVRHVKSVGYEAVEVSGFTPCLIAALGSWFVNAKLLIGIHANFTLPRNASVRNYIWKNILNFSRQSRYYAISNSVLRDWIVYSKCKDTRVTLIYNSIEDSFFESSLSHEKSCSIRSELNISVNTNVILFVGRLMASKGIDTLYKAFLNVIKKGYDVHLICVGRLDDCESELDAEHIKNILRDVNQREISNRISFLGERTDVKDIMRCSNLLVHPARHEGFGLVLAEALAIGLPVVSSDVGGIPEVLAGTDSIMVNPGESYSLGRAIMSILDAPSELIEEMANKNRKKATTYRAKYRAIKVVNTISDE